MFGGRDCGSSPPDASYVVTMNVDEQGEWLLRDVRNYWTALLNGVALHVPP